MVNENIFVSSCMLHSACSLCRFGAIIAFSGKYKHWTSRSDTKVTENWEVDTGKWIHAPQSLGMPVCYKGRLHIKGWWMQLMILTCIGVLSCIALVLNRVWWGPQQQDDMTITYKMGGHVALVLKIPFTVDFSWFSTVTFQILLQNLEIYCKVQKFISEFASWFVHCSQWSQSNA